MERTTVAKFSTWTEERVPGEAGRELDELIYDIPEALIPEDHEEHIDFTVHLDIDKIMLEEPAAESERIGLAAETDADNRDKITDCDLTPSPAWSPDDYGDGIRGYPEAETTPIEVEDDEDNGEMHAEEPNRNEKGIPTEFIYTLQDTTLVKRLRPSQLTKMIHSAEQDRNRLDKELNEAGILGQGVFSPLRKVWEVYVGRGRVSECLRARGDCEVEVFSYQTGWDFDKPKDRAAFLRKLKAEEPDEVLITPACRLRSSLQELSASRSGEARKELMRKRLKDHDTHLVFTSVVYETQRRSGRHVHG